MDMGNLKVTRFAAAAEDGAAAVPLLRTVKISAALVMLLTRAAERRTPSATRSARLMASFCVWPSSSTPFPPRTKPSIAQAARIPFFEVLVRPPGLDYLSNGPDDPAMSAASDPGLAHDIRGRGPVSMNPSQVVKRG
jgi:hypothetical protein